MSVTGDITGELSYGTYDDLLEAAFGGTWTTDALVTGTTRRSFAILKRNLDIGVDTVYRGCQINQVQLNCPLQEKITAVFSVVGKSEESYTVPADAVFGTATTTDYMTTFEGSLSVAGSAFTYATDLNATLNNNIEAKYSLFERDAYAMREGMIDVTGQLSAYIEDDTLKDAYRNETDTAFIITMTDAKTGGNKYTLTLPKARFTSASDSYSGDDLGIQQLDFRSLYDATATTEIKLERTAAA